MVESLGLDDAAKASVRDDANFGVPRLFKAD
jgi:hypothetical protein